MGAGSAGIGGSHGKREERRQMEEIQRERAKIKNHLKDSMET